MTIQNKRQKLRFMITGALSTSIDFGVLFLLHGLGMPSIAANFISTSIAFCFSFTANRHYTFKAHDGDLKKQIILFLVFTLIGIWIIQPVIIGSVAPWLTRYGYQDWINLAIAKLLATGVTLLWNYFFYTHVVFKTDEETA